MTLALYTARTGNGMKPVILLEELGLPYDLHWIDIMKDEQFAPDFLEISPNNKIPALVDGDFSLFESGALLIYLAEREGRFWTSDPRERITLLQWMFFQVGSQGPMLGQAHHFRQFAPEQVPYAISRYSKEANRIYGVMDRWLACREYFAGDAYSIVDMMCFPWTLNPQWQGVELDDYPHVLRWREAVGARPGVARARAVTER